MGWYEQEVFNPFILDKALDVPAVHAQRAHTLAAATGDILEIGVGTGLNLPAYPAAVRAIASLGPEPALHAYAVRRAIARDLRVEHTAGDARRLPFDAGRFDVVVAVFVLCTVPEPARVVRECARVLRPGGKLLFLEHVAAQAGARRTLQRLLNAPLRALLCGCELTRDTERVIAQSGLRLETIDRFEFDELSWLHRSLIRGAAVAM